MKKGRWEKFVNRNIAIGLLLGMLNSFVFADIRLDRNANQNTSIDRAQNNQAVIININTPNSRGISVNDFENFQTKEGVVFNNFGEGVGRSYLAGMMAANPNLSKEQAARLILNRVGGNNRVEIEAFLEVMSHDKTDVLFSSTNGFYLNNTGFINFDKVMFTTSRVDLDGNGNLLPFNVREGNITVGRDGINAEGVRYLALLSKSINVDGQINAKDAEVDLIAGNFDYNPDTKNYTKQGINNNELLISSSAYGSLYGNQIRIVAVNGDVGVKGDVISERVLRINADGTVVTNRTQAKENIEIKAKEYVQEGSTYSEGKVRIEADKAALNGTGTQTGELEVTGNLDNNTTVYSKGNVTVGRDVKSKGQLLSEGSLEVKGNLESENLVYGKDKVTVGKNLVNKSDMQSENDINIDGDVSNSGKILADKNLNIKGNTVNQGTLYGKDSIKIDKNLQTSGNIQTGGELSAKDTVNTGTIIAEGNITTENLDNSGEILTNEKLSSKNIENKSTGKTNTGNGISTSGNVKNQGTMNTNDDLTVNGNLENQNIINAGGTLTAKDIVNTGTLKVSDKIVSRGVTFTNSGEILTENLDVDVSGNILNSNKLIVLDNAKIKGNSINNQNYISATNMELITLSLTNSGTLAADEVLKANNTFINNIGYIGSNQKVELNNTNLTNSGTIESATVNMGNLSGYGNTGLIRGNSVVLTSGGNLTLNGTLHGEDYLQINGLDILNAGVTTGTGYIEIKGRDITNNTELASEIIVLEGTGTVVNNSMITGENGRITGYDIVNNDLIAFSDQLGLKATDKITNNAGKAIYGGELLDIEFNTLENLSGELLSTGLINLKGNYLLNQTGMIQSSQDISIDVTKVDNIGSVSGLNDYEIYYVTWDGQIYTEAEFNSNWAFGREENAGSNAGRVNHFNSILSIANAQGGFNSLLDYYYGSEIRSRFVTDGEFGVAVSDTLMYLGESIKGKVKSNAITNYANISAGNNITITGNELNNKDGKISAGNTAELTVGTITNTTTLGAGIQLKDGYEEVEWHGINNSTRPVRYRRLIKNGDISYVTGQVSVIEARNLIINTGSLILTPEIDADSQIITGSTTSGTLVAGKTVSTGVSNGSGMINIVKNMDPILEIKATGVLPINPLAAQSSLFSMSKDPTSKYLLETRSQYINIGNFYGSDYYLSRIGYDENSDWNKARRLGDAYYEYLLVTRTISEKLGTRFINGLSDSELMKAMLDNSVELQKDLQLTVGVALTADQVKALKSDIIWYEYEVVNGEKVLVPKVYLSQATLATIETDGRNKIGGLELTVINADELRNNGQLIGNGGVTYVNAGRVYNVTNTNELSEIRGNEVTVIATAGNIENIGGRIKGIGSVALVAENGDIINSSSTRTSILDKGEYHRSTTDHILSVGSIESEGTTYVEGKNYTSQGGSLSGGTTVIDVKENIEIGSLILNGEDKFGTNSNNYQYYKGSRAVGSEVSGTENVILGAGKDITVQGSMVASDGLVQMTAENINILNGKETDYLESKAKYGGTFSKTSSESKSSQESASGSTIIGNNIILDAEKDINVRASNLIAVKDGIENTGGNISMTAGNDVNILVDMLENSYYSKTKTSGFSTNFSSGGGGLTAGVSYSKSSLEQQRNGTTAAVSTIISEGSAVIDAGNKVRTEAMQANIGENLVIRGTNGVELLDAKEVFQEKVQQKSTTIGLTASVGSTVTSFIDQASNMYNNKDKYGVTNTSEMINSAGDGLTLYRSGISAFNDAQSIYDKLVTGIHPANALAGITANVSLSFSQSKYESNTSGTNSVAGNINVGKNFILESEGDVLLVNQKINIGENFIVDARNFEARAGENTYSNNSKSSSTGGNIGYDFAQQTMTGGANISGGKTNTSSKTYDNTVINTGGTFQLTTKEDAIFAGVNVTADKINFDIGKNLSIISLQDEYKSEGKNYGIGGGYSQNNTTTNKPEPGAFTGNVSYGQNNAESKWVNNQTSIIANNGGNVKVGETLTNVGAIIGSLSEENKLSIEANKVVVSNLEDYNRGENAGINVSGIGVNNKAPIGQTGVQYGSHDKEQDTKATFVNTEVTEAGKKLNFEELGINTDISKAQVVTKDEVVEQIDTNLHTDLLNTTTRQQLAEDTRKAGHGILDIIDSANSGDLKYEKARFERYSEYYIEKNPQFQEFKDNPDSKSAAEIEKLTKDYIKYMTGKDVDVVIVADGTGSGYIRGDQQGEDKKDVFKLDLRGLEGGLEVSNLYGHEASHVDDHRRGRNAGDEETSGAAGDRLTEILGENGKSSGFDIEKWLSNNDNKQALIDGRNILDSKYEGYEMEGHPYKAPTNPNYYYNPNQPMDKKPSNADVYYDYGKIMKPIDPQDIKDLGNAVISILSPKNEEKENGNSNGNSSKGKNKDNSSNKVSEKTCDTECFTKNLNKDYYYNPLNGIIEEKNQEMSNYYNPSYFLTDLDYKGLFTDAVNDITKILNQRPISDVFGIAHTDAANSGKILPGFNTKENLAIFQEKNKSTELYNIYDSVKPGGITKEEADRLNKTLGNVQAVSTVRDELHVPLLVTIFTQLGYEAYNKKYGLTDVGGGIQVVGKYAPEVVARDVTNSMNSGTGQLALPSPVKYTGLPAPIIPTPSLTVNEVDALVKYTGSSYYENLNNSLRGLDDMWVENKVINDSLKNVMNKFTLQEDMTLYRGTSKDGLGKLKNLKPEEMVGEIFTESAYMSTSMKPNIGSDFSDGVTITIKAPKGTSGLNVTKFSEFSEAEILLDAGQKMKITNAKVVNGELHLEVEILK
ncbi:hemagglutinin repeat-containing protein [Sebaldella sp. S0638]|uniref:hemagglutinin repeat-containing protein n=1 Tax=Sebaldella sp. S0638 TaxID=2957809 RepID=UPI00209D88CD|nr:hemagglutinin repeat-containing protein [Sebaldella sp. S0638]MCP1226169.1 hemagglutinin repeat-containing protein [Sebaldella sp. S0638]